MKKYILRSCALALVLAAAFSAAGQSVLISIDQGNPAAVQFITTGANSFTASSLYNVWGVDLISYFTAAPAAATGTVTGTLTPTGTSIAFTEYFPDNLNAASSVDLNMYVTTIPQLQAFTTSSPAFTGTAIINLSSLLAYLPATGASGDIFSGDVRSPGKLIGTWQVVPEPTVGVLMALGAIGFAGLALVRRARHSVARW
jgi:hypothetical protein